MKPVVLVDPGTAIAPVHHDPVVAERVEVVDIYDFAVTDLAPFAALVVTGMADQEFLWQRRDVVASFLASGRVVVFCGHLLYPWLPGCGTFVPAAIGSFHDYAVHVVDPSTVYAGVDADDLTFRRGVAGFFARGHHPPPPGAQVLARLAGGQPVTWVDRAATAGTVFTHAGDMLGFADAASSAGRLTPQLLDWAAAEGKRSCLGR